jgi:microcin C transport system substrate-binding protein
MRWLVLALCLLAGVARADDVTRVHSLALIGKPELPDGFTAFPYVNPDAPRGGEVVMAAVGTFDSFNPFIVRGNPAPVGGLWESLTTPNVDEPTGAYGLLAETIELPADHSWIAFDLRPEAKWHDGTPITSEDVAWTFNTLREKGRPFYRQYWAGVDHVETDGPHRVVFRFKGSDNRELGYILGELQVLPKHWFEGRDFTAPLTDPPLGSGPYTIGHFEFGRTLVMDRVADYWGRDLPTRKGQDNFDHIRTEYFRDPQVAREAFKAGQIDFRRENSSKSWATFYDFPAVTKGLVKKEALPQHLPTGMQGFIYNIRRPLFQDRRVREALAQVFDFEWTNKNLFYGLYTRTESYFSGSDFASSGLPTGAELALLEPFRDKLPAEVFSTPFKLPVTDGSGNNRAGLIRALDLLRQAGWEVRDRKLVNAKGEQMHFEILLDDPAFERIVLPYKQNLERLGIDVAVRTADPSQYQQLSDSFNFDMTVDVYGESDSPGNEQADYWGCKARDEEGSGNEIGVCDPVVDALVAKIIQARDRDQLIAACRALDRVLLWSWYLVPNWHLDAVWVAYWDRFGHPDKPVRTGLAFDSWWLDAARAKANDAARGAGN